MKTLFEQISEINEYSLVTYLRILGYTPISESTSATVFEVKIPRLGITSIEVDLRKNLFISNAKSMTRLLSGPVALACMIFDITCQELLENISLYRLDILMSTENSPEAFVA